MRTGSAIGQNSSSMPPIDMSGNAPLDGLADALGLVLARAREDWRREHEVALAKRDAVVAEMRAELAEHRQRVDAMVAERLAGLKDGKDGEPGAPGVPGVSYIGLPGKDGENGKDADPELVAEIAAKRVSAELTEAIRADVEAIHSDVQAIGAGLDQKIADRVAAVVAELPVPKDGNDGVPGERGERGDAGPQGERGIDGVNGSDGVPGERGEIGPVGPQGEAGLQGERGIDGAPGEMGPAGLPGPQGERGEPGEAIAGPPGERGDLGPSGERGERGLPGFDAYQLAVDAGFDGSIKGWLDSLRGEVGAPGESIVGPQGEQGEKGDPGESIVGPRGEKGDPGESIAGPQGERGEAGPPPDSALVARLVDASVRELPPAERGEAGPEGPRGEKGDPGESIKGDRGEPGLPGESIIGPQGERGERGDPGETIVGPQGERGPEGPVGKLPIVKAWQRGVHYEGDVRTHAGATYQALKDTAEEPPHEDWVCLAERGEPGSEPYVGEVYGLYEEGRQYRKFDLVHMNGSEWRAKRDNPGPLAETGPVGDGWALAAKVGKPPDPRKVEKMIALEVAKLPPPQRGPVGPHIVEWITQGYEATPMMSDGKLGPSLDLREFFELYDGEAR